MNTSTNETSLNSNVITYAGETFIETTYNDISVIVDSNGYYRGSKICADNNKEFREWLEIKSSKTLLSEYSSTLNLTIIERDYSKIIDPENSPSRHKTGTVLGSGEPNNENNNHITKTLPLIYMRPNTFQNYRGYYIHPDLVNALCMWCDIKYWIKVNRVMNLINEEIRLKNITLNDKISEMSNHIKSLEADKKRLITENELLQSKSEELVVENERLTNENTKLIDNDRLYSVPKNYYANKFFSIIRLDEMDENGNSFRMSSDSTRVKFNTIRMPDGVIIAKYTFPATLNLRQTIRDKMKLGSNRFKFKDLERVVNIARSYHPKWTRESVELDMLLNPEEYKRDPIELPNSSLSIDHIHDNDVTDDVSELNE